MSEEDGVAQATEECIRRRTPLSFRLDKTRHKWALAGAMTETASIGAEDPAGGKGKAYLHIDRNSTNWSRAPGIPSTRGNRDRLRYWHRFVGARRFVVGIIPGCW